MPIYLVSIYLSISYLLLAASTARTAQTGSLKKTHFFLSFFPTLLINIEMIKRKRFFYRNIYKKKNLKLIYWYFIYFLYIQRFLVIREYNNQNISKILIDRGIFFIPNLYQ